MPEPTTERPSLPMTGHWIGGRHVDAVGGGRRELVDPATAEAFAVVAEGDGRDVDAACAAAGDAFPAWSTTTPSERSLALLRLAERIEEAGPTLAALEAWNTGKPLAAAEAEIPFAVDNLRFFAGAARTQQAQAAGEYAADYTSMVRREPLGLVAAIAPWNYPLMMAIWKIAPALAAGNTVVLKPAELTPLSTLALAEMSAELLPPGVLNVVTGDGDGVGAALVDHPDVAAITLTGEVSTGQAVSTAAARRLARTHLELGGKAPMLVFDDADIGAVAEVAAMCGFGNSGQDCTAACRLLVTPRRHDDLVDAVTAAARSVRVGAPFDGDADIGPLVSASHADRARLQVSTTPAPRPPQIRPPTRRGRRPRRRFGRPDDRRRSARRPGRRPPSRRRSRHVSGRTPPPPAPATGPRWTSATRGSGSAPAPVGRHDRRRRSR